MRIFNSFRYRLMLFAQLFWLGLVCLLGAWWGRLIWVQAGKIAELEQMIGVSESLYQNHWQKMQRMLFWEVGTFFILVILCTGFVFWLYWRDSLRVRGLQTFFATVAHELRTPLSSIRLQVESIADQLRADSLQKNFITRLIDDTIRMETQVEKTLELARLEGGGPVYIQPLQLKSFVDRFLSSLQRDFLMHSRLDQVLQFKNEVADLVVQADESALQVILRNLIENSLKHSHQDHLIIRLFTELERNFVVFVFQDNGLGYSGPMHQIGKPFQKGPKSSGAGIGLYLIQFLMKKMKGSVQCLGGGSGEGFTIRLSFLSTLEAPKKRAEVLHA